MNTTKSNQQSHLKLLSGKKDASVNLIIAVTQWGLEIAPLASPKGQKKMSKSKTGQKQEEEYLSTVEL